MFEQLFASVYTEFNITSYLICSAAILLIGALLAFVHSRLTKTSASLLLTVILLPFAVQTVIMLVNGNLGTGIAIAGAFGLIRFRSIQCKPEEIVIIFIATVAGLANAAGYIGISAVFTVIACLIMTVFYKANKGLLNNVHRMLKITVPEGTNYENCFNDLFERYLKEHELVSVKTTNMGSLFRLTYDTVLMNSNETRNFINELRTRNGNLEITLGMFPEEGE